jgi:carboxymethylenebutenolidase
MLPAKDDRTEASTCRDLFVGGSLSAMKTSEIMCGDVAAYYARPDTAADFGVLVLPSIHGRDPYVLDYVHMLAEAGFPTLCWDLFAGLKPAHTREDRAARQKMLSDTWALSQMTPCLDHMLGPLALKRVAALGFCLGGRYGLLLAETDHRLAGLVSYYPTIETPRLPNQQRDVVAEAADIGCPVHMITAGKDHLTSHEVFRELQANLQRRPQPTSIQFFPQAEHAFLQVDRRPGRANEQAVALSRGAALSFLGVTFSGADRTTTASAREPLQA